MLARILQEELLGQGVETDNFVQELNNEGVTLLVLGRNFVVKPLFGIEVVDGFQVRNLVELVSLLQKKAAGGLRTHPDIDALLAVQFLVGVVVVFEEL
jgi:hypothetical protein